ncbi:MAG: DUF368 domain-containing protein, partial [Balneolaceae bacterium]
TGIYNRLVYAVKSADSRVVRALLKFRIKEIFSYFHWKFLLMLLAGIFSAVLFFTKVVPLQIYMYTDPELIYGLFFGLILGSIYILVKEVESNERNRKNLLVLVAGTLFGFWVVTLVPTDSPENFFYVFGSGMIAFCAMILPGISGSYLLLILGKYDYVLTRLSLLGEQTGTALIELAPLFLGGIVGLMLFSRLLTWLLQNYYALTLMVLIGFLIGSLYVIWPYQERTFQEYVRSVELYDPGSEIVRQLENQPADTNRSEYLKLGSIVTTEEDSRQVPKVEVIRISRNLIQSKPFIPLVAEPDREMEYELWWGIFGMAAGMVLVGGIERLRKK